jgi:hypothetical protein
MITITTSTLIIILVAVVGLVGWVLAYKEYENKIKVEAVSKDAIAKLIESQTKDKQDIETANHAEVKRLKKEYDDLNTDHKSILEDLTVKHKLALDTALETREEEIVETEKLVTDRIEEIESVYRSAIDEQNESLELYEKYIRNFDAALTLSDKKLKDLDIRGTFSSDDEIGFFFQSVRGLQGALNNFRIDKEVLDKQHGYVNEEIKE